jgi:hypothetical protein
MAERRCRTVSCLAVIDGIETSSLSAFPKNSENARLRALPLAREIRWPYDVILGGQTKRDADDRGHSSTCRDAFLAQVERRRCFEDQGS